MAVRVAAGRWGERRKMERMAVDRGYMTKDEWGHIQQQLLNTVGKNNYTNWIAPLELADVLDGTATFHVPTNFLGNYVSQNFGDLILYQLTAAGAQCAVFVFKSLRIKQILRQALRRMFRGMSCPDQLRLLLWSNPPPNPPLWWLARRKIN